MRFGMVFILIGVLFSGSVFGQEEEPPPPPADNGVLRIDTLLVEIPLVVSDPSGKPILNLKPNNFVIYEDGKKQEITDFASSVAPFEVALLLDTSGSTRGDLRVIKRAAEVFIESLRPGDRVAIVGFKSGIRLGKPVAVPEILTAMTSDRKKLIDGLNNINTSNGTPFYDGMLDIAEKIFNKPPEDQFRGRRAVVALTDGVDSSSDFEFTDIREALGETGVAVYFVKVDTREYFEAELLGDCETSVRFSQSQIRRYYRTFYPRSNVEKQFDFCCLGDFERLDMSKSLYELASAQMKQLAENSGGKVFPAASLSDAKIALGEVAAELGTRYSIGYYPENQKRDGRYRKIRVELKNAPKGAVVRAREGYTAPAN
ncbi:MAG: VWA domain-containing protein [Pyrinomonadaceae bacterium]|nr:VWA domain-containing protein [Pyrinomonadaceae bacterium]